jgi:hypothetical protein
MEPLSRLRAILEEMQRRNDEECEQSVEPALLVEALEILAMVEREIRDR